MMNSVKVSKNTHVVSSQPSYTYPSQLTSTYNLPPPFTYPSLPSLPPSTYPPPPPSTYPLPPPSTYPLPPSLSHLDNDSYSTVKVVPELKEFLKELDATYGEGKYTQYLEIFENNDIRVNLISKISDEWWENKLHITSLGHVLTLKEAASKYV